MNEFSSFLRNGYEKLEKRDRTIIDNMFPSGKGETIIDFISFNYTPLLEQIVRMYSKSHGGSLILFSKGQNTFRIGNIYHMHNILTSYIVIGADSVDQIKDSALKSLPNIASYCVKERIIEDNADKDNLNKCYEVISSSNIIYAYGVSFGETDKSKWVAISKWIKASPAHKLIVYKYGVNFKKYSRAYLRPLYDEIDNHKIAMLQTIGFSNEECGKYLEQISIIDSSDVLKINTFAATSNEKVTS